MSQVPGIMGLDRKFTLLLSLTPGSLGVYVAQGLHYMNTHDVNASASTYDACSGVLTSVFLPMICLVGEGTSLYARWGVDAQPLCYEA